MSRKFEIIKDYYDENFNLYKKKSITIKPGVTVLVGCNGIGKTTLLEQMKNRLNKLEIPCISFDNLHEGGSRSISKASFYDDFEFMATAMCSSEGETIRMNIGKLAGKLRHFIETGEMNDKTTAMSEAFKALFKTTDEKDNKTEKKIPNERWILLDAVDSGLSVDNIVDIKEQLFKTILEYNYGNEIYIVVSANEYEMANGEQCFDVYNGKYVTFKNYEEYRKLILESKNWKTEREK